MSALSHLTILQYNVQKSKDSVLMPLLEDPLIQTYSILAIQEPWKNHLFKPHTTPLPATFT